MFCHHTACHPEGLVIMLLICIFRTEQISESAKRHLRDYRLTHHISGETHVALLKDLGWTVDEYEVRLLNVLSFLIHLE